jgi:formylglycine-generating enzyme required for sulfatase activity
VAAAAQPPHTVAIPQAPDHPVIRVNREQALEFCRWLTKKEQAEGWLPGNLEYRLPSDLEWSTAADLHDRKDRPDPAARNQTVKNNYVWGVGASAWPPSKKREEMPGNFSDISRLKADRTAKSDDIIAGYDDGFPYTAPVGSFLPNKFGIYDLAGNASEWISDKFGGKSFPDYGVTRGGSWGDGSPNMLLTSARNAIRPDLQDGLYGFRVVIARKQPQ